MVEERRIIGTLTGRAEVCQPVIVHAPPGLALRPSSPFPCCEHTSSKSIVKVDLTHDARVGGPPLRGAGLLFSRILAPPSPPGRSALPCPGRLRDAAQADELIITTITHDHADRVRSYQLLAEEWARR
jgi:hypothetical protein